MKKIVCAIVIFSLNANANFTELSNEFLDKNIDILTLKWNTESSLLGVDKVNSKRYWSLAGSAEYEDSDYESSSTLAQYPTSTTSYIGSISRSFIWGGDLVLSETISKTNQSKLSLGTKSGTAQEITYTQNIGRNFLGRIDKSELTLAKKKWELSEAIQNEEIQKKLLNFFITYNRAKLNKALVNSQRQALKRSQERLSLIRRRVSDGLREKVDLIQARANTMNARETLDNARISLMADLSELTRLIHRRVLANEISDLKNNKYSLKLGSESWNETYESKKLAKKLDQLIEQVKANDYSMAPDVSLSASLGGNDYDLNMNESISNGTLWGDNKQWSVKLSATWPLGYHSEKVEKNLTMIEKRKTQKLIEVNQVNFIALIQFLKERIEIYQTNIDSTFKRQELAEQALKEYNRLYSRGRADLDQVIRAEEDLIQTQIISARYIAQRDELVGRLHELRGDFNSFLSKHEGLL